MKVVKLKLTRWEVGSILAILWEAAQKQLYAEMKNETIILAEHYPAWLKKFLATDDYKLKSYTVALSLARIIFLRLQFEEASLANQSLLSKLDQELTNLSMKPKLPTVSQ